MWLPNWEFSDTVLWLTKTKIIFAVSPKKGKSLATSIRRSPDRPHFAAQLLNAMQVPENYDGPMLEVITRNLKQEDVPQFVTRVMAQIPDTI